MYGHLSRVLVSQGDPIKAGQVIALSGNTGRSTAPHLHFEVRHNGHSIDPLSLVREGT
jgi:murein DD-endopeptidase MepM/ murein hydrolase activator NlpD